jgi:hypothetical protein
MIFCPSEFYFFSSFCPNKIVTVFHSTRLKLVTQILLALTKTRVMINVTTSQIRTYFNEPMGDWLAFYTNLDEYQNSFWHYRCRSVRVVSLCPCQSLCFIVDESFCNLLWFWRVYDFSGKGSSLLLYTTLLNWLFV